MSGTAQGKTFAEYRLLFISKFKSMDDKFDDILKKHDKLDERVSDHILADAKWKAKIVGIIIGVSTVATTVVSAVLWVVTNIFLKDS
jgi:hypothetical protein